jgi:hypothetical protein
MEPMLFRSTSFTNRYLSEVLPDGSWRGHPAFIVGGGPSLAGFDFQRLRGKRSIGVNIAFHKFDPTIIFSMDTRCLNWILKGQYEATFPGIRERFEDTAAYKVWLLTYSASLPDNIFIVPVYGSYEAGLTSLTFDSKEGIGHGNNSGYAALNLALALKADPIYLMGFDCNRGTEDKSHWHAGHPIPQNPKHLEGFIKRFQYAAPLIKKAGVRVVNLNPASALGCFEFGKIDEVLQ